LQDWTQTSVAYFETCDDWINSCEFGEWIRSRNEHRPHCLFYGDDMGCMTDGDFHGRRVYTPNNGASERDNLVANPRSAYQGVAVPAIDAIITCTPEDF